MSLTKAVTKKVDELGRATADEVASHFPDKTPEQVRHALANSAYWKRLKVERHCLGIGGGQGSAPAVYVTCKASKEVPK